MAADKPRSSKDEGAGKSDDAKRDKEKPDKTDEKNGAPPEQTPKQQQHNQKPPGPGAGHVEPTDFEKLWNEYVHRIKVHELLRCLEVEQKKLQVLQEHLDSKDLSEDTTDLSKRAGREAKVPFQKPLDVEEMAANNIAARIREAKGEPDYVEQSVKRLFESGQSISSEQFAKILDLCKDERERSKLQRLYNDQRKREMYLPSNATQDRQMLYEFLNSGPLQMFMLIVISLSTIILYLLCFELVNTAYSYHLIVCDSIIMSVFLVEAGLKIYIYRGDYFRSAANILDLIIIVTHFLDILIDLITVILAMSTDISSVMFFKFLKSLRAFRVLRAIKFLPNLQIILTTIVYSLMSISSIAALMILYIFVFAVAGRELFREEDEKRFGNFFRSSLTLFQLLTLDDWGDILEENGYRPLVFLYLFFYIIVEYFVFLNLFVAVLVDNFQLSIEATSVRVDEVAAQEKWTSRLEALGAEASNSSLRSRHNEPRQELGIEEYLRVDPESKEAQLLTENLKKLTALDYQYFMWNRRMSLSSLVLQAATDEKGLWMGQADQEISPVDVIEPRPIRLDDIPLKPKLVPKKAPLMGESNFELLAVKKKRRRSSVQKKEAEMAKKKKRKRRRRGSTNKENNGESGGDEGNGKRHGRHRRRRRRSSGADR